ncbi:MAG: hypothetical protein ACYC1D_17880, partial [Acidimicrobiales bacterium]
MPTRSGPGRRRHRRRRVSVLTGTAALRDILHAATAFGRVASAAKAVELGYAVEADDGPSGRLGHWRIAGMPEGACQLFSKRS